MVFKDCRKEKRVIIYNDEACNYSYVPPYHPNQIYPEYPFPEKYINKTQTDEVDAYSAVRDFFKLLGHDNENYGTPEWNPLKKLISPGSKVVIKPNFVLHLNTEGHSIYANLTHPSVIRAVADYCIIALKGTGSLKIVENPQMECELAEIEKIMNLKSIQELYKKQLNLNFEILDTRRLKCKYDLKRGYHPADSFIVNDEADPLGYSIINLGKKSYLEGLPGIQNLYGADFDRRFTAQNHTHGVHKYCVSNSILDADTVICIPKMKTHKKVGVTLNIKLLVGINGDKNYLAHYRVGPPSSSGDEFPDTTKPHVSWKRKLKRILADKVLVKRNRFYDYIFLTIKKIMKLMKIGTEKISPLSEEDKINGGNWHGNDTAWRMAGDLAKIFIYADKNGNIKNEPQRNILSIIDGIIAGEGNGPMGARPKHIGALIGGQNILAVDTVTSIFMGFDPQKIKMISNLWQENDQVFAFYKQEDIEIVSEHLKHEYSIKNVSRYKFVPHKNWTGYIEINDADTEK